MRDGRFGFTGEDHEGFDNREPEIAPDYDLAFAGKVPRDEWAGLDDRTSLARYLNEVSFLSWDTDSFSLGVF